jgi:GntR family transcriptional regulator, rspAB operon transcriptional repressor
VDRVCNLQLRNPASIERLVTEHQNIMNAIDMRNTNAAGEAMRLHLNGILNDLPQIESDNPDLFE